LKIDNNKKDIQIW